MGDGVFEYREFHGSDPMTREVDDFVLAEFF